MYGYTAMNPFKITHRGKERAVRWTGQLTGAGVIVLLLTIYPAAMQAQFKTALQTVTPGYTATSIQLTNDLDSGTHQWRTWQMDGIQDFHYSNQSGFMGRRSVSDQDLADTRPTVGVQDGKYGIGFASSWPAFGLSGTYHFNETFTGEAILGFFGVLSNFGARGWYRFNQNHNYDLYGYGALSLYQYRYNHWSVGDNQIRRRTENVPGIGAGAGLQYGLRSLFENENFPPLFFNLELGIAWADFDHYNFSTFVFGSGLQYRFGER
jgi:hypothetical protein